MYDKAKNIVILGAGESGLGAALLAYAKGKNVFVSDYGSIPEKYKKELEKHGLAYEENGHDIDRILQANIIVKSPGIPDKAPVIKEVKKRGIPVISEIEYAYRYAGSSVLTGITGANGKTTVTMMLHHILRTAGKNSVMAGNIGYSFARSLYEGAADYYALELSSFQLDGIRTFRPHIAILTNITPDHLDRYDYQMSKYVDSKFRISMNQTPEDYFIYDADDAEISAALKDHDIKAKKLPFSYRALTGEGAGVEGDEIHINIDQKTISMSIDTLAVQGKHNVKNSMAAMMAAHLLEVRRKTLRESMRNFEGAPHRLEKVLKVRGVQFINDSKATNVNATYYALDSMRAPTVWVVGGVDKGNDYTSLMPLVREKVKAIVCLGVDNEKILETFSKVMPVIVETKGAEEAVKVAYKLADPGDNVLLSPACASFDLFRNYEDRGDQFKQAVLRL